MASFLAKIIRKKKGTPEDGANASNRIDEVNMDYDRSLPTLHSYLGNDLEELRGRTVLDDDSCQNIQILTLPGIILIPGQTLPLLLVHTSTVSMMANIINSNGNRTFGLVNSRFSGRTFSTTIDPIGTTAEVRSFRQEYDSRGNITLTVIAEGRQRFEILETRRQDEGIILGKVRILPELSLEDPGLGSKLNSLDKFRFPQPNWREINSAPSSSKCLTSSFHKYNKYDFANYTHFPSFVYKMYDPLLLMERIQTALSCWNKTLKENRPCNPKDYSYWVAANLPLDDDQRIKLLKINEVTERLREELKIIEEINSTSLCCRDCMNKVAKREEIFSMSLEGPQATYVNSNGYVHEAITVYNTTGLSLLGRPTTQHSWFPGYAWTIAECEICHSHIGWLYTCTEKLKPPRFWALCRGSIRAKYYMNEDPMYPLGD